MSDWLAFLKYLALAVLGLALGFGLVMLSSGVVEGYDACTLRGLNWVLLLSLAVSGLGLLVKSRSAKVLAGAMGVGTVLTGVGLAVGAPWLC